MSGYRRWFHDSPGGMYLPRRGCDAASFDRRHARGESGWDGLPKRLTATPMSPQPDVSG